jgi:O-antigen/teichoic acid export membrane protein
MATPSLKEKTLNSAIWMFLGFGSGQILRFGGNLALTAVLEPKYFGIMAVINTIMMGGNLLSDVGIAQSIVNHPKGETREFLDTAWSLQIVRSLGLWLLILLLTPTIAGFYNDDQLRLLLPVTAISALIDGLETPRRHVAQRRLDQRAYNLHELLSQAMHLTILVVWAYHAPSIWALVGGGLIGGILRTALGYWVFPGPLHRWRWDPSILQDFAQMGRWIFLASATMFAAEQSDRLILAKLVDWQTIGVYAIAYNLSNIPRELVKTFSYQVIYPAVVQAAGESRDILRTKILKQRRLLLWGSAIILATLVTSGDLVIDLLYNAKYAQATWMMPLLCGGIWFSVLFYTISQVLIAIDKPMYAAQCNVVRFLLIAIGIPVCFHFWQLPGAILAIAFSDMPLYLANLYGLKREQLSCIQQDIEFTGYFIVILATCLAIRYLLFHTYPIESLLHP